jgi:transglutaminase-like putative cysteine protease
MGNKPLNLRNIVWIFLALAMVAAPHAERLPLWVSISAAALGLWRLYIAQRSLRLLSKWLLLPMLGAATAGIYFSYGAIFGRDAGVALLVFLIALKLMEMRSLRDAMVVLFLSYFLVITNFLYSQTILAGLYMLLAVLVITAAWIGCNRPSGNYSDKEMLKLAGTLLIQAVPLMVVFFLLFPRVQGPLWGLPQDAYSGITGLSDTMSPGSLSELTLSDAVAFRVKFDGPAPKASTLYWRGPVLWRFNGRTWFARRYSVSEPPELQALDKPLRYTVTLEPHNRNWLFALDIPGTFPPQAGITSDFQVLSNAPVRSRMRYEIASYLKYQTGADEDPAELRRALQLPRNSNPRARELAQSWRRGAGDDEAIINQALNLFRKDNFYYTLLPPLLGEHPVDEFLFDIKRGFCEHYASGFAFLMRAAGIPARIVTGYQGGDFNAIDDYFIVRQADAHAWVEVWLKQRGWVRIDPTAAVSPLRVESGIAAAVPATDPLPLLVRQNYPWLRQARFIWDAMANDWNQWVLGYTPQRQAQFLTQLGMSEATWQNMAIALLVASGFIMLGLAGTILWRLRTAPRDPVQKAYHNFCGKLAKKGLARRPAEGPQDYALRLAQAKPRQAQPIRSISELYIALRYGTLAGKPAVRRLRQLVSEFEP